MKRNILKHALVAQVSVAKYDTLSHMMMIMIRCEEKHTETCTGSTGLFVAKYDTLSHSDDDYDKV